MLYFNVHVFLILCSICFQCITVQTGRSLTSAAVPTLQVTQCVEAQVTAVQPSIPVFPSWPLHSDLSLLTFPSWPSYPAFPFWFPSFLPSDWPYSDIVVLSKTGEIQMVFIMESIMEHVAKVLRKSPEEIKFMNLYQQGQVSVHQSDISEKLLEAMWVRSSQSTTKITLPWNYAVFYLYAPW